MSDDNRQCVTPTSDWIRDNQIRINIEEQVRIEWEKRGWDNPPRQPDQRFDRRYQDHVGLRFNPHPKEDGFTDNQRNVLVKVMKQYCYELAPAVWHIRFPAHLDFWFQEPDAPPEKEKPFKSDYKRFGWLSDFYGKTDAEKEESKKRGRGRPKKDKKDDDSK